MRGVINNLKDKEVTCKICGDGFLFGVGEQQFYHDRQLAEKRRCHACLRSHRQSNDEKRGEVRYEDNGITGTP